MVNSKSELLPRIAKAAIWGILTFILLYYIPIMLLPEDISQYFVDFDLRNQLLNFALISVFFSVVGQLFAKTIIGCGFGIAKAIIIIAYFFIVSEGGVFNLTFPTQDYIINFTIDISIILLMIIAVNLLGIAKNLFEAINILNKNSTNNLINHKGQKG